MNHSTSIYTTRLKEKYIRLRNRLSRATASGKFYQNPPKSRTRLVERLQRYERRLQRMGITVATVTSLFLGAITNVEAQIDFVGQEVQVNTHTIDGQRFPHVAMSDNGEYVVTWASEGQDGDGLGIFMQRYHADGSAAGSEMQVNASTSHDQTSPSVAMDSSSNFVITWCSRGSFSDGTFGTFAQRYDTDGMPVGGEILLSTSTAGSLMGSDVAMHADGSFVATWQNNDQDGDEGGVFARRVAADGTLLGDEFQVNDSTSGSQERPSIAMDAQGNFVIVWHSTDLTGDDRAIVAKQFAADGTPIGSEFKVNASTTGYQIFPSVAMDDSGNFIVSWTGSGLDPEVGGILAQRFLPDATPNGSEFQVSTNPPSTVSFSEIAMHPNGAFIVTWDGPNMDGDFREIHVQGYGADATKVGDEIWVNTYTTDAQWVPSIAMNADSSIIIAWEGDTQDGDSHGIFAQRLSMSDSGPVSVFSPVADKVTLSISPNPADRVVRIEDVGIEISIYSLTGELITKHHPQEGTTLHLDVEELPQGIYLVSSRMSDGTLRQARFVKR